MRNKMTNRLFVLGDADLVRRRAEGLLLSNQLHLLRDLSEALTNSIRALARTAESRMGAEVVVCGGDEILFLVEEERFNEAIVQTMMADFSAQCGLTISFGVGRSSGSAFLELTRAKARGPGTLRYSTEAL
jgi:minimal CRISPR polymerase domain